MECYHIWTMAVTGNAFFRWKRCYHRRAAATAAVRRWREYAPAGGHRPAPSLGVYMVRLCDGPDACPCTCGASADGV